MSSAAVAGPNPLILEQIRKIATLATLPEVTSHIISTVENPNSTAGELHKIVSHDPALVTRVLKVVNSAFYGLPGQIGSIERAIVLLGLNAVKNIAVAASLGQLFRGVKLCGGYTARDLWGHCVAVAVSARELARETKLRITDEAFLAGMIHDVGILVALQASPEQMRTVCETSIATGLPFCEIERETFGFDHQELGEALAVHWKFPRACQQVAGHHHHPESLGEDSRALVSIVYIADTICCEGNHGFNRTAFGQSLDRVNLSDLNLTGEAVERVRKNIPALIDGASSLLG